MMLKGGPARGHNAGLDIAAPDAETGDECRGHGVFETLWVRASHVSLQASVGIYRGERDALQEILLDMVAEVDQPRRDIIADAVDYRSLVAEARQLAAGGHIELIETFVRELARRIMNLQGVRAIEIELLKPAAIPPAMASVRFRAERRR